jgi:hypothetical protein
VIRSHFHATNNVVEYEALKNSLRIDTELGVQILYIYGDSELVVNQVMGESNYHDNNRSLESWRRSSMILNFIISSGRTMKQPMPSLDSGLAMKHHPPQACSCKTYSSCPSGSGAPPSKGSPTPASRTPPGAGSLAPTSKADLGTPLGSDTNWWKLIFGYLRLRTIPNDKTETQRLTRRAKEYLIRDD